MESINILRLKTGEDIICYMEHYGHDEVMVREPMLVLIRMDFKTGQKNIGMDNWLPTGLIKYNETLLKLSDVITVMTPSSEFTEYYENIVASMNKFKEFKEDETTSSDDDVLTQEDMSLILESMDQTPNKVVH